MIKFKLTQSTYFLCGLVFLFSCEVDQEIKERVKTDSNGVIIGKEPIWKHNSGSGKLVWAGIGAAVYDNHIIVAGNSGENEDLILALDLDTGEEKWRWEDFMMDWPNASFNGSEYGKNQKDNLIILSDGRDNLCIDIANGKTVWKDKRVGMDIVPGLQVYKEKYYYGYGSWNGTHYIPQIIEADISTPSWKPILFPKIDTIQNFQDNYGFVGELLMHEEAGDLIVSFGFTEYYNIYESKYINYFSSYNVTKGKYIIEKLKLGDISHFHAPFRPVLFDDIIVINSNASFYGIHKDSGDIVWIKDEFQIFNGDGIFNFDNYQGDLIAVNWMGPRGRVMKINPKTGKTVWERIEEGGHAETLHFYRDVLYFVDRGTGHLNAYDLNSGNRLWRLDSPDSESFSSWGGFLVIPSENEKKGRLIASTFLNTYCFQTER